MTRRLRRLVVLGGSGLGIAWLLDRQLRRRAEADEIPAPTDPIRAAVLVRAPIDRTWDELTDIPGQVRWMADMKSVRILTPGPVAVGTRAEATIRVLGVTVIDPVVVTAWEPPRRFGIEHLGLVKGHGLIELDPGDDPGTTRVAWGEVLLPPVFPHLGSLVLRALYGPILQDDLDAFAEIVEASVDRSVDRSLDRPFEAT